MIAVIKNGPELCVAYWTGRQGFSVAVRTYCGAQLNASDGVLQVPDKTKICKGCDTALKKMEATLPA